MRYLLLIYGNELAAMESTEEDMQVEMEAYNAFTKEVSDAGAMLGGEALQPSSTATTVRVRNGQTASTDGPFAETKEQLGGYHLIECKDLDEALSIARRIPTLPYGGVVEVRPLMSEQAG